jgi:hypothetical protein
MLGVECVVRAGELAAGPGPRLAAEAGRRLMFSVELSTREWDGHVAVALDGELDLVDAADVAAVLVTVTALVSSETPSSGAEHGSPRQQTGKAGASALPHSRTAEPMTAEDSPAFPSAGRNTAKIDLATVVPFPGCGDDR